MSIKFFALLLAVPAVYAETGYDAWLRYAPLSDAAARPYLTTLPAAIKVYGMSPVVQSAQRELIRGVRGMLGRTLRVEGTLPAESAIVLGTAADLRAGIPQLRLAADLPADSYVVTTVTANGVPASSEIAGNMLSPELLPSIAFV